MLFINQIKKHILVETVNKIFLLSYPFMTSYLLKIFFKKNNIGHDLRVYAPLILHNTHRNNLIIGSHTHIGRNVLLDLHNKIQLGENITLSMNVCLITHFDVGNSRLKHDKYKNEEGSISIGNDTYLGANVTVLHGVTIGKNCIIGANSLVTHDIPDNCLALGTPAKVIKNI